MKHCTASARVRLLAVPLVQPHPPPDLLIEVDITSPTLDKFSIYARASIPEIWRHDGESLAIFELRGEKYIEVPGSSTLLPLTSEALSSFIEESTSLDIVTWMRLVRKWVRENSGSSS